VGEVDAVEGRLTVVAVRVGEVTIVDPRRGEGVGGLGADAPRDCGASLNTYNARVSGPTKRPRLSSPGPAVDTMWRSIPVIVGGQTGAGFDDGPGSGLHG
jgi:hypothetical protein